MTNRVGRKPTDADYGLGEHSFDGDRLGLADENELKERLIRSFSAPDYRPPQLPAVATELLALSQRVDVEFDAIESMLERDAMLAGDVLSVSRSVVYSGRRQVGSLREALVRVGLTQLRRIVMQAALNMRVFRSAVYGACMERLQEHSRCIAHLCRIISRFTPLAEEQAFLCGLMHDVGIAGILLVLGDVKRGEKAPDLALLWPAIDAAHAPAGARMVELWGIPAEISMVVGAHHQIRIDGYDHPLAAALCLAEALALDLDVGLVPTGGGLDVNTDLEVAGLVGHERVDRSHAATVQSAREALQFTDTTIELILADAREWQEAERIAGAST